MGGKPPTGKGTRITENERIVEEFKITSESNRQTRGPGPWEVGPPPNDRLPLTLPGCSVCCDFSGLRDINYVTTWPARNYNKQFREPVGSFTTFLSLLGTFESLKHSRHHHPGGKPPVSLVYILFRLCLIEAQFT